MVPEKAAEIYKKTIDAFGPAGIKFVTDENAGTVTKEFSIRTDDKGQFIPESVVEHESNQHS